VDGDIEVSEEWSSSSQSGDISLVDFPVEDSDHPLGGCGTEYSTMVMHRVAATTARAKVDPAPVVAEILVLWEK
jgi:hypothetical protein